jgi:ABC-type transport system involved in multi-copper enzyme maturation permease subunit
MTAVARRLPLGRLVRLGRVSMPSGIAAIMVKELRGRMRGRRAFIIVTIYVLLLAGYAWTSQQLHQEALGGLGSYGGQANFASATIGRGIFGDILMLQTLMVAILAPAATAGAISSEREHQTLELLAVTPISSLAIVVGKLLSALAWVFVLVLASIPVTALVFVFGGVAPDDVLRGYAVLLATVIGLGSIGLFFSALTRRTGASTGLTFVTAIALVLGMQYLFSFLAKTAEVSSTGLRKPPSEMLLYLDPFAAQADVICGTEDGSFGDACAFISGILAPTGGDLFPPDIDPVKPVPQPAPGIGGGGVIVDDRVNVPQRDVIAKPGVVAPPDVVGASAASFRDRFWPKSVASLLLLAIVLTVASVQFVTPTRRWRPSLPGPVRRLVRRRSAT